MIVPFRAGFWIDIEVYKLYILYLTDNFWELLNNSCKRFKNLKNCAKNFRKNYDCDIYNKKDYLFEIIL